MRVQFKNSYDDDINLFEDRAHLLKYAALIGSVGCALVDQWLLHW
jgi:branched-chain amino acid transport system permease protein